MRVTKKSLQTEIERLKEVLKDSNSEQIDIIKKNDRLTDQIIDLEKIKEENEKEIKTFYREVGSLNDSISNIKNDYSYGYVSLEENNKLKSLLKEIYIGVDKDFKISKLTYDKLAEINYTIGL